MNSSDISRRRALQLAGAGAAAAVVAGASSSAAAEVVTKPTPGGSLPAIGLGSFMTFDKLPHASRTYIGEVMSRFWRGGGRVIDTSALYGMSEENVGLFARRLGITDEMFITDKTWACGDYLNDDSHAVRQLRTTQRRLHRQRIDVLQVHSLTNVAMILPILKRWKAEKTIGHVGVTTHEPIMFPQIEYWIENGDLDFIQIHYSIFERSAEERLLSAAADNGVTVMVNMPLEKARLHKVVGDRRLPGFAAEIGCANWAQFFLKYVISHPAVTCAHPATTNPDHVAENVGAMRGPLPDQRMRRRMVEHMESIPGFADIGTMPWYPGKRFEDGLVKL